MCAVLQHLLLGEKLPLLLLRPLLPATAYSTYYYLLLGEELRLVDEDARDLLSRR